MTEDELYDIIETYVEENDIDKETEELVQNAIEFSDSTVKEVMTPWDRVVKINVNTPSTDVVALINGHSHSRYPVVDDAGNVVGTLGIRSYLKSYLKDSSIAVGIVMNKPEFIFAQTPVDDLLMTLSEKRTHMAYVKEDHKVSGIITVEDILEELVGEIYDEEDEIGGGKHV